MLYLYILLGLIAVTGIAAFAAYGVDKAKAKRGKWRVPEATLLTLSLLGGFIGALLAMVIFRHKTKRFYFWAVNIFACALYCAAIAAVCIYLL